MSKSESESSQARSQDNASNGGQKRERWTSSFAFVMVALGSCIGLGSLWRFPTQCAEYGGGAFFVPYIIGVFVVGFPISILEAGLGQIYQGSCIVVYAKLHERFRMAGVAGCYLIFTVVTFYTSLIAYFVRMLWFSFFSTKDGGMLWDEDQYKYGSSGTFEWVLHNVMDAKTYALPDAPHVVPAEHVTLVWQNVLCLMVVYLFVFLSIYFGTKVTAYVTYVAVILPFIFVIILFFHGLSLDGAVVGIYNYIGKWDMSVLTQQPTVWSTAISQVLFSLNLTSGVLIVLASYQEKGRHITKNQCIIVLANTLFCIITGFAIFAVLGHSTFVKAERLVGRAGSQLEYNTNLPDLHLVSDDSWETLGLDFYEKTTTTNKITTYMVNKTRYQEWFSDICTVTKKQLMEPLGATDIAYGFPFVPSNIGGPALVLGSYPAALASMPAPHFFSVVFFLTLFFMGGDSIFGMVETMTAVLKDTQWFHDVSKKKINIVLILTSFTCSLPYMTTNGFLMMDLTANWVDAGLLSLGLAETVVAGWIYGASLTIERCGKLCTYLLPVSIFGPALAATILANTLEKPEIVYPVALAVCAVLLTMTFVLLRRRGDNSLTYREKFRSMALGNLEMLRDSMNATFLQDPLENRWYRGVPKYVWSFCIKFICPTLLLVLLVNTCAATAKKWNEDGALPFGMQMLALAVSYLTPVIIIVGLVLPSRYFSNLVHTSYTLDTACQGVAKRCLSLTPTIKTETLCNEVM